VAISGDTIVAGAFSKDGAGSERGAAYVFERNEGGVDHWDQVKKLTASDAVDGDHFGWAVAISIDAVVVGAHEKDGAGSERGAAYVFQRNQGGADNWGQVEELVASDAEDGDSFGISVAISTNTILVGAYREDGAGTDRGAAYLFRLAGGQWLEVARPTASDAEDDDQFGISVAISGDTAIVGAHWKDGVGTDRGAAYLLERNWDSVDSWGEVTKIVCFDCTSNDYFGRSVSISGDTAVVGAWYGSGTSGGIERGAAYVYERNWNMYNPPNPQADNWGEIAKLTASDAADNDHFGFSVSISGDSIVVGAWHEDGAGSNRGAAYVFGRNQGGADNWGQVKKLTASDAADGDYFGTSVAISGDTAIVGAFGEDGAGNNRGAAYIYQRNYDPITPATPIADNWGQVKKLTASDAEDEDNFGISVAISRDTAIVGAHKKNLGIIMFYDRGAAYIYTRNYNPSTPTTPDADNWGEVQRVTASPYGENYAYFGRSVSISGDTAVVGAYAEDGAGSDRGAAYVFERNEGGIDNWGQVIRLTASDAGDGDYFGFSAAISGDTLIVGAYGKDGTGGSDRGAAYIFPLREYRVYLPLVLRNY